MAAHPGSSMEKPSEDTPEAQIEKRRRMLEMLKQAQMTQPSHPMQPPPNNHLPPPFVKQNGPLPFRESPANELSFAGIPIGRGPPQSAFPVAPGPPQKIWLLEKEMIQKAQAAKVGSTQRIEVVPPSRPPVCMQPMVAGPPPDQAILSSSPQVSSQANRVWQKLFPNARIGAQTGPEPMTNHGELIRPSDPGNKGLRQILGRVVDVSELEGVFALNQQPSVRPPPGFENYQTSPSASEQQSWLLKKRGGGAIPPLSVAGSPQHGVSLMSKWKSQSMEGPTTPPLPAELAGGGYGGAMMPGASSPIVGAHRPQSGGGYSLFNQNMLKGSSAKEGTPSFWDNFSDPFTRNKGRKGSGSYAERVQDSSVIEASRRLEDLDLGDFRYSDDINYSDDTLGPEQGEAEKKKKRSKKSKKRAKKSSECGENAELLPLENERPPLAAENITPSTSNGEKAPDRKRPRRKSRGKKSKADPGAFDEYLDIDSVMAGLKDSSLISGEIRINAKNYKDCYINDPDDKKDILISGTLDRNRALEGDVVVVQLKEEEPQQTPAGASPQKSGKVVYILEKVHTRVCVGYLTKIGEKDTATLCPRDSRIPRLLIPLTTLSIQIAQNPSAYENILFKAKIVSWDAPNFAQGIIVEELGKKGNVDVETVAILKELDLDGDPVPDQLSRYLPTSYSITQEEIDKRLDLRKECIFTIDPETARDLDDAVSIKKLGEDLFEVGVHISDVSMFLTLGTPLDVKVSERATTIYLVDKAIHMLPLELCLQCSLLPGQDKYAVSVIWQMDSEGNIKDTKFARTVIHSCTKLAYEHAQAIIEGRDVNMPALHNNVTPEMVKQSVLELYKISTHMTKRRFAGGALRIDQPKVSFRVNEKLVPTDAWLYELKDSNR